MAFQMQENSRFFKKKQLMEWVSAPSTLRPSVFEKLTEKSKSQVLIDKTRENFSSTIKKGKNDFKKGMIQGLKWFMGITLIILVLFAVLIKIFG